MKRFLLVVSMLSSCASFSKPIDDRVVMPDGYKAAFKDGECGVISKQSPLKERSDGTALMVIHVDKKNYGYIIYSRHVRFDTPTVFDVSVRWFDENFDKVKCPESLTD